jgi:hypothetical protein
LTRPPAPPRRWRWFGTAAPETQFLPIAARPVPDHKGYFQVNRVARALPGGWTFLIDPTKRTVVRSSGDPDRFDVAAALRRGTRA